jgi:hypothetical protein
LGGGGGRPGGLGGEHFVTSGNTAVSRMGTFQNRTSTVTWR